MQSQRNNRLQLLQALAESIARYAAANRVERDDELIQLPSAAGLNPGFSSYRVSELPAIF